MMSSSSSSIPMEIIHHIQSMIKCEKEAARTALISKSWCRAWCTRPDLIFNQLCFRSHGNLFWEFAKTTLKRYEDLNLNIRSLTLNMQDDVSLAKELIVKALKLGVINLTIRIFNLQGKDFVLPAEVLQSQTLARLNLIGPPYRSFASFTTELSPLGREKKEVTCLNLKSLKLDYVAVINGDLFSDLISACPLIEEVTLNPVKHTSTSTATNLMDREIDKFHDYYLKLKYLSLFIEYTLPRHDLWAKFACLKELEISYLRNDDLKIRIPSLELMSILLLSYVNVEFDFPNIRKFKLLRGVLLPRQFELKTSTTRRDEWVSEIDIDYRKYDPSGDWFRRLSQFLRMLSLSRSRVSLSISMNACIPDDEFRYFGDGLAIPEVEKFKLEDYKVTPAFLDALFWSCRPKFVEIGSRCLFGLKKVNVEEFQQLRSLPWETFYHVRLGHDVRFQLN